jgi:hypothetical protein
MQMFTTKELKKIFPQTAKFGLLPLPTSSLAVWKLFGEKCENPRLQPPDNSNYFNKFRPQTLKDKGLAGEVL